MNRIKRRWISRDTFITFLVGIGFIAYTAGAAPLVVLGFPWVVLLPFLFLVGLSIVLCNMLTEVKEGL